MINITPKTNEISDESFSEQESGEVNASLALESDIEVESESYQPYSKSENQKDVVSEEREIANKKDARIFLKVSTDKLSAYIKIVPPDGGKDITAKDS